MNPEAASATPAPETAAVENETNEVDENAAAQQAALKQQEQGNEDNAAKYGEASGANDDVDDTMDLDLDDDERAPTFGLASNAQALGSGNSVLDDTEAIMERAAMREELEEKLQEKLGAAASGADADGIAAAEAWQRCSSITAPLAQDLCEQLRLILEESKAAKLRGDYRTGKRLNMRKIIPYIASEFRKDKIWLRRTKPSKREYQIMMAIDDSASMSSSNGKQLAIEALSVISKSLTTLEAGELSLMSFGEIPQLLHPFGQPFTEQTGSQVLQNLTFQASEGRFPIMVEAAISVFNEAKLRADASSSAALVKQLMFIVSDSTNIYQQGIAVMERRMREAADAGIFVVFVIIDGVGKKESDSVLNQRKAHFVGGKMVVDDYMDRFADKRYIVLRDINMLPLQLGDALRQWFEMVSAANGDL